MKAFFTTIVLCSSLLAQAPPAKKATSGGAPSLMNPGSLRAKAPDNYKVQFTTTKGNIVIEIHRDWAPLGADRFYNLVRNGFFADAAFFRVVPNFIVQFGLFVSPIAFASADVPEKWRALYTLNPLVGIIDGFRWSLLGGRVPLNADTVWVSSAVTVLVIVLFGSVSTRVIVNFA